VLALAESTRAAPVGAAVGCVRGAGSATPQRRNHQLSVVRFIQLAYRLKRLLRGRANSSGKGFFHFHDGPFSILCKFVSAFRNTLVSLRLIEQYCVE